jgi:hypothetical protein
MPASILSLTFFGASAGNGIRDSDHRRSMFVTFLLRG